MSSMPTKVSPAELQLKSSFAYKQEILALARDSGKLNCAFTGLLDRMLTVFKQETYYIGVSRDYNCTLINPVSGRFATLPQPIRGKCSTGFETKTLYIPQGKDPKTEEETFKECSVLCLSSARITDYLEKLSSSVSTAAPSLRGRATHHSTASHDGGGGAADDSTDSFGTSYREPSFMMRAARKRT